LIHPKLKSRLEKILPHFVLARLDPIREIIEAEVRSAAEKLRDGQIALDAGAGEAHHRRYFVRGDYFALDSGVGDPEWNYSGLDVLGDVANLPIRKESVDCILCMEVLEHVRNPRQALMEFARALKAGGSLYLIVPFLWEEHQAPHDYHRFTSHGIRFLFRDLPLELEQLSPMGGFFWICARRCVNLLGFFQGGWRWLLFVPLAPFFGLLLPLLLYYLDGLDRRREFSLGFCIHATKKGE
jgi:SAM-dependent methyltransferase